MLRTGVARGLIAEYQDEGLRITKLRGALVDIFTRYKKPLSIGDLLKLLKFRKLEVHRVSLYRELDFLEEMQLVQDVSFGRKGRFFESMEQGHHHHAVCTKCDEVVDVDLDHDAKSMERTIEKKTGFSIARHALEFFGLCKKCQKSY